jgi:hypothetical protein
MIFYLGVHQAHWVELTDVPLCLSRRTLARCERRLRMKGERWCLDSGGFSELSLYGRWRTPALEYAGQAQRFADEVGPPDWAAVQDWMCEPDVLARTGKTVEDHQRLTIDSFLRLVEVAPDVPWMPVLQGWAYRDYLAHLEQYRQRGIDLKGVPLVGVGSVCRRQDTDMIDGLIRDLADLGYRLHGFGFKLRGLARTGRLLASADSMAWSLQARRSQPLPGCPHANCADCLRYALSWRRTAVAAIAGATARGTA